LSKILVSADKRKSILSSNLDSAHKIALPLENYVEESDLTERFKVDVNARPQFDDVRARKIIVGEL
jgi:hypothetical protein